MTSFTSSPSSIHIYKTKFLPKKSMINKMENHISILLLLLLFSTSAVAQTSVASGPTNVTKILEKAGQFTTLIRLLGTTQVGPQIDAQLNNSGQQGITFLAPTDAAFSALPAGTLNSLSDQQKVSLLHFHVISTFLSMAQFQTVSNPLRTQAGDTTGFPLNVTTSGNQVNVSTGVNDASIANTIYTDGQLAVYQVDKVLLPVSMFGGAPAPAVAPAASAAGKKTAASPVAGGDAVGDSSGAVGGVSGVWGIGFASLAAVYIL